VPLVVLLALTSPAAVWVSAVGMICCCCCGACCGRDGAVAAGDCHNGGVGCSAVVAAADTNAAEVDSIVADNGWAVGILPLPRLVAAVASCAREPMEPERE